MKITDCRFSSLRRCQESGTSQFDNLRQSEHLFDLISEDEDNFMNAEGRHFLPAETVDVIINSMDTEFGKQCVKAIILMNHSRKDTSQKAARKVIEIIEECESTKAAAQDMVKLRWEGKCKNVAEKIEETKKKNHKGEIAQWPCYRLNQSKFGLPEDPEKKIRYRGLWKI